MKAVLLSIALASSTLAGENHSTFEPSDARNPFVPIGYVRPTPTLPEDKHPDIRPDMFKVTAILLGEPSIAIINRKEYAVGDVISIGTESVTVQAIKDGNVTLRTTKGKAVTVGLRK